MMRRYLAVALVVLGTILLALAYREAAANLLLGDLLGLCLS